MTGEQIISVPEARLSRALRSLDGLSVGDAFGQCFFSAFEPLDADRLERRTMPSPPWRHTDDTEMAICITEELAAHGQIVQDELAMRFARRYMADPDRGYGGTAQSILCSIYAGQPWPEVSGGAFEGLGSMGNGSAMRVAPLGAYFADDVTMLVEQAQKSAEVTHFHPEGLAGAIAVALAAAFVVNRRRDSTDQTRKESFEFVLDHTPDSRTREGIDAAARLKDADVSRAARVLGNGSRITCPDTVPLCLWCAARHLDSYVDALWTAVAAFGDIDTNCAIVGGIVALGPPDSVIPAEWLEARGPLDVRT